MTKLIATYDFRYGTGNSEEIVRAGDEFIPRATAQASAADEARHMIARGAVVTEEVWNKTKVRRTAGAEWARGEVERMNERRRGRA